MGNSESWDEFIHWAERFHALPNFSAEEIDFKIALMEQLGQARRSVLDGAATWQNDLRKAFEDSRNNLTTWRIHDGFLDWVDSGPDQSLAVLRSLWTAADPLTGLSSFLELLPTEAASGPGTRLSIATFLLMATDPPQLPVYRWQVYHQAMALVGWEPPSPGDGPDGVVDLYRDALAFLDALIVAADERGLHLRHRLDAQSVMWCVMKWRPSEDWPILDQRRLSTYRGDDMTTLSAQKRRALSIQQAVELWDRDAAQARLEAAEAQRVAIVTAFPIDDWPNLPVERYAVGVQGEEPTYCRALEFNAVELGSIKGGSAHKHLIFKPLSRDGWEYPNAYASVDEAWNDVRSGFVRLLELAAADQIAAIDDIDSLSGAAVVRAKTVFVYFPDKILPIYAQRHLDHWLNELGLANRGRNLGQLEKNQIILDHLRSTEMFDDWSPIEISHFMYWWRPPVSARSIWKIAPGELASQWPDCLSSGHICLAWDELGDLSRFADEKELRTACAELYSDSQAKINKRARQLWAFRDLSPGDVVVANNGTSEVVGIGTVTETGYQFDETRSEYCHTVGVEWEADTEAKLAEPVKRWATDTVAPVSAALYRRIRAHLDDIVDDDIVAVPTLYSEAEHLLERHGQIVLYGPPGTGKTFHARRLAVWLLDGGSTSRSDVLADQPSLDARREDLQAPVDGGTPRLVEVTFHPTYSYEDFVEGYKPVASSDSGLKLALTDGLFKRICESAAASGERHVIVIDEINRANLPKVFGELITLVERDKRGTHITLPQSGAPFSVPDNVVIIGTMNTADRSIHLMDAALRRRFGFVELLPDAEVLEGARVGSLDLGVFLDSLNQRIRQRLGREKQVGHAIFMTGDSPVSSAEEFALVFRYELLPLLQEYSYDDYRDLQHFLGDEVIDAELHRPDSDVVGDPDALIEALARLGDR